MYHQPRRILGERGVEDPRRSVSTEIVEFSSSCRGGVDFHWERYPRLARCIARMRGENNWLFVVDSLWAKARRRVGGIDYYNTKRKEASESHALVTSM